MVLLFSLVGVLLAGLIVAVLLGKVPTPGVPDPARTTSFAGLPEREVTPDDLDDLRFDAAVRGYRMDQVDAVLNRLSRELRWGREEIARLHAQVEARESRESAAVTADAGYAPEPARDETPAAHPRAATGTVAQDPPAQTGLRGRVGRVVEQRRNAWRADREARRQDDARDSGESGW